MIRSFRDLRVWSVSLGLAKRVYALTRKFPSEERFGLSSQMRRASVSIPSNIAEGFERESSAEFVRFLLIARGSLGELETQIEIAFGEEFLSDSDFRSLLADCQGLALQINGLIASVRNRTDRVAEESLPYGAVDHSIIDSLPPDSWCEDDRSEDDERHSPTTDD